MSAVALQNDLVDEEGLRKCEDEVSVTIGHAPDVTAMGAAGLTDGTIPVPMPTVYHSSVTIADAGGGSDRCCVAPLTFSQSESGDTHQALLLTVPSSSASCSASLSASHPHPSRPEPVLGEVNSSTTQILDTFPSPPVAAIAVISELQESIPRISSPQLQRRLKAKTTCDSADADANPIGGTTPLRPNRVNDADAPLSIASLSSLSPRPVTLRDLIFPPPPACADSECQGSRSLTVNLVPDLVLDRSLSIPHAVVVEMTLSTDHIEAPPLLSPDATATVAQSSFRSVSREDDSTYSHMEGAAPPCVAAHEAGCVVHRNIQVEGPGRESSRQCSQGDGSALAAGPVHPASRRVGVLSVDRASLQGEVDVEGALVCQVTNGSEKVLLNTEVQDPASCTVEREERKGKEERDGKEGKEGKVESEGKEEKEGKEERVRPPVECISLLQLCNYRPQVQVRLVAVG